MRNKGREICFEVGASPAEEGPAVPEERKLEVQTCIVVDIRQRQGQ